MLRNSPWRMLVPAFLMLLTLDPARADDDTPAQVASEAIAVLEEIMQAPDRAMPRDMLRNAYAVAVLPNVIKAGLIIGGRHGEGLVVIRNEDDSWSTPSFITLSGGSIGLQLGVSSTDVVLIFRSPRGVESIRYGKFLLGTDLAVAAGPVGRNAQAATDAQLRAEVYAYSRAKGLFLGLSLQGSRLRIDDAANIAVYGAGTTAEALFSGAIQQTPTAISSFRAQLAEYTSH